MNGADGVEKVTIESLLDNSEGYPTQPAIVENESNNPAGNILNIAATCLRCAAADAASGPMSLAPESNADVIPSDVVRHPKWHRVTAQMATTIILTRTRTLTLTLLVGECTESCHNFS